jgi:hypothetical protein
MPCVLDSIEWTEIFRTMFLSISLSAQGTKHRIPQRLSNILSFCGSTPNHSAPSCASELWYVTRPYNSDLASQEVLKKVLPYHCLGYIWSQMDKAGKKHMIHH